MSEIGDNSVSSKELRSIVDRLENLGEEIKGLQDDKKDLFALAKSQGFDAKVIRKLLAIRKMKNGEYEEEQMMLDTYMAALSMI